MGHPHPPLGLMDILEVESCRMKTAVGLGLVKGSANQPLSQTTGLLRHRARWDRAVRDIPFLALSIWWFFKPPRPSSPAGQTTRQSSR